MVQPTHSVVLLLLCAAASAAVVGEPKPPYPDRPDDQKRERVEIVSTGRHAYEIDFRGTVDGVMTRMPIGYSAFHQGWQPNRSVTIANVGRTVVKNPRLLVNDKRNWRTLADVVAEATRGYTAPADRARALWEFIRRQRFHATTGDAECYDVLKVLNVYGYTLCGDQALVLADLWKAAGFQTRPCHPIGHCVGEVFYDGRFHLFDSDEHVICLLRDNRTIADEADIVRDHDLIKRTHTYGIGTAEDRKTDEFSASLYSYEGKPQGQYGNYTHHTMDFELRPGESLEFRWDHVGKHYCAGEDLRAGWGPVAYDDFRNALFRYQPDLADKLAADGAETIDNARFDPATKCIGPADPAKPAAVTWRFASPYVFVGGSARCDVELPNAASAEWFYSVDQKNWQSLTAVKATGTKTLVAALDQVVSPRGKPTYRFWLRLVLVGGATATNVAFGHEVQTAALSLPELEVGANRVLYQDDTPGERQVRITHRWLERTSWRPPEAPAATHEPADGVTISGTQCTFRWQPAADPDGDRIVDYHFELSQHADMRWPLSPNFEKLTSLTPAKGEPRWTVPYPALLNPDTTYYWRVRARDSAGVWGPWSRAFSFRCRAPGVPLDVEFTPDPVGNWTLSWRSNPQGTPPIAYKVYGSNEKGFSVSDTDYPIYMGKGFVRSMEEFEKKTGGTDFGTVQSPANLVGRVTESRFVVVGPEQTLPNANKAFYRVVAVDAAGVASGPSDYAEVSRPLVCSRPPRGKVGQPYDYRPKIVGSLGDLRCRATPKSSYNAAFWDGEQHSFSAVAVPDGLKLDPATGAITGVVRTAGKFAIAFRVADQFGKTAQVKQELTIEE